MNMTVPWGGTTEIPAELVSWIQTAQERFGSLIETRTSDPPSSAGTRADVALRAECIRARTIQYFGIEDADAMALIAAQHKVSDWACWTYDVGGPEYRFDSDSIVPAYFRGILGRRIGG